MLASIILPAAEVLYSSQSSLAHALLQVRIIGRLGGVRKLPTDRNHKSFDPLGEEIGSARIF